MLSKNNIFESIFTSVSLVWLNLVNLTTAQVETLFGELEYIESQLRAMNTVV